MTSPLPPRRRDTKDRDGLIRHLRTNAGQLGVGFMQGRFPPLRPLGAPALIGDLEDDNSNDNGDDLLRFVNADSAVWSGTGDLVIGLSHVPWSDSPQVKLNGHELEPGDWAYDASLNTVTIPAQTWWEAGKETGTAYYAYFGVDDPPAMTFEEAVLAVGNPILWATLGDSSGATAQDNTTHNRDGAYGGTVDLGQDALAPGLPGTSVDFHGTGWVDYGTAESWQRPASFSAMIWGQPRTDLFDMFMFGCDDLGSTDSTRAWHIADDTAGRVFSGSTGYPSDTGQAIGHLTANVTTMLLLTFDGATLKFYKDADLVQTIDVPGAMNTSLDYPLTIGASADGRVGRFAKFDGFLQHAVMWDVVATPAEIAALWATGTAL